MTDRSEKNRCIAKALGYKLEVLSDGTEIIHELDCCNYLDCECEFKPIPDFYTDEKANFQVLCKL